MKAYALLSPSAYHGLAAAADRLGLVLWGHVPESLTVRQAITAGQRSVEHLGGKLLDACSPIEADMAQRRALALRALDSSDGVSAFLGELRAQADEAVETFDAALCTELAADLAATQTFVAPTLVVADLYAGRDPSPSDPRLRTVPEDVRMEWAASDRRRAESTDADRARSRQAEAQGQILLRALRDAGVPLLASTDAGWVNPYLYYGASLHDELERYVAAGLTPAEALLTATRLPAQFLGRADELGAVRRGYVADLVLLDANPLDDISHVRGVYAVIAGGRLYDRAVLDGLLGPLIDATEWPSPGP